MIFQDLIEVSILSFFFPLLLPSLRVSISIDHLLTRLLSSPVLLLLLLFQQIASRQEETLMMLMYRAKKIDENVQQIPTNVQLAQHYHNQLPPPDNNNNTHNNNNHNHLGRVGLIPPRQSITRRHQSHSFGSPANRSNNDLVYLWRITS